MSKTAESGLRVTIPSEERPPEGLGQIVWERFRRHPGARAGAVVFVVLVIAVLLAPLSPYDPEVSDLQARFQPPSWTHLMGTDALGRDLLTRVLYGGRVSMTVGLLVVGITMTLGVTVGALAGYWGGVLDSVLMRITDAALTLPSLLVLVLLGAILRDMYTYDIGLLYDDHRTFKALLIGHYVWWDTPSEFQSRYNAFVWDINLVKKIDLSEKVKGELFFSAHNILNGAQYILGDAKNPRRWIEGGARVRF